MIKLQYTLDHEDCEPFVGSEYAAGLDLRIYLGKYKSGIELLPGETKMVGTGVKVAIPEGWVGFVVPRSSTGKLRVQLENTIGVIDSDYRGEIKLRLYNFGDEPQAFHNFDRICQLVILPHFPTGLREKVDSLDETVRGGQGFGHSGRN